MKNEKNCAYNWPEQELVLISRNVYAPTNTKFQNCTISKKYGKISRAVRSGNKQSFHSRVIFLCVFVI